MRNETELKRKSIHQGVHLSFGVDKERAGSLPRFVEKFTSRLEYMERAGSLPRLPSRKPALSVKAPLCSQEPRFVVITTTHFSSALSQQLATSV